MKTFYLLRHEDVHSNSGTGTVAEGVIFDSGMVALTWLSEIKTVTVFPNIKTVNSLHSHGGKTEVIIQGNKRNEKRFAACKEEARLKRNIERGTSEDV
jgi:hypothetical protein